MIRKIREIKEDDKENFFQASKKVKCISDKFSSCIEKPHSFQVSQMPRSSTFTQEHALLATMQTNLLFNQVFDSFSFKSSISGDSLSQQEIMSNGSIRASTSSLSSQVSSLNVPSSHSMTPALSQEELGNVLIKSFRKGDSLTSEKKSQIEECCKKILEIRGLYLH